MKKAVVVVPVHSASPSTFELISFSQCFKILHKHPIRVVAPEGLDLSEYRKIVADFVVVPIKPEWQSSLANYNKLKISKFFYRLFSQYEFLLTYELDCFVFKDELDYWCNKGYDYIGAPWFEGFSEPKPNAKIIGIGNSGFSLRSIPTALKILNDIFYDNPFAHAKSLRSLLVASIRAPYRWLRNQFGENYTIQSAGNIHEDFFFSTIAPTYSKAFKLAPVEQAIRFSFEVNPDVLYKMTKSELPMGCHAWWRYNLDFWKPFIESFGHDLSQA